MAKGHNHSIAADRLKSFIERIEKMEEEQAAIAADKRDIYSEAKGVGYDVKTIRWVVQERKADAADRDERDTLRDTYAHALGMAVNLVDAGMSLRQAEAITGVSKSSIQRARAVPDCPIVEMHDDDLGKLEIVLSEVQTDAREMVADDLGDPLLITNPFRARVKAIAASVSRPKAPAASDTVIARAPIDTRTPAEIMGEMPAHLRRVLT
jgi:uncharacterized protein (UPF0335 family)